MYRTAASTGLRDQDDESGAKQYRQLGQRFRILTPHRHAGADDIPVMIGCEQNKRRTVARADRE